MSNKKFKIGNAETAVIVIGVLLLVMFAYNGIRLSDTSAGGSIVPLVGASEIIPTGIPDIYGKELGVSFDDVTANNRQTTEATISKLKSYQEMSISGAELERYVKIGSMIACEFCCGAKTLVFADGSKACGCAHSGVMRGLAKYLITEHGDEYTDDEILTELAKWKVLFFPGVHETKAAVLKAQGIELNYINLASNLYRGIEKGQQSSGGMVGGC